MTPKEKKIAMDVRVKQMEIALLGVARAADRECSDISLAMGHDSGRGWDPDAHLQPIVDAIRAALRERDAEHEVALKKARADALEEAAALAENDASYQERGDPRESALRTLAGRLRALLEEAGRNG